MERQVKKHFDRIQAAVKRTGNYNEADDIVIEHAAATLALIDDAKANLKNAGQVQVYQTGATASTPELNNLRGLMKDFRDYCDVLGISPKARKRLDIQIQDEERPVSRLMKLRQAK